eukprot:TRINITY_DN5767_c1_g1_i1.p1 TRINITY_DN5767_c1_g1~~TRINITY_DN5767_c1_g1_i1.p1  ORF type:complete len:247 (-),score=50.03 TRINITY_DN5767_c1_g1_i1:12-752(-)
MCATCKETAFARAVGTGSGSTESASLNAASLAAYQVQIEGAGGPSAEEEDAMNPDRGGGKGKGKQVALVLPTGDLVTEVRSFCHRFNIDERLQTKVMDALKRRSDADWRQDLAEMNKALSTARNPSGMLCVKLGDIDKQTLPNQLCFNFRAGTCTFGNRCRYSHDVATGYERQQALKIMEQAAVTPIPAMPSSESGFGSGPRRTLRRRRSSSSGSRKRAALTDKPPPPPDGDRSRSRGDRRKSKWD